MSREMEERVEGALRSRNLPYAPCGLNADWCVSAWHIGPGKANWNQEPQLYLLDTEDGDDNFNVVWCRYDPDVDDESEITEVAEGKLEDMLYVLLRERELKFAKPKPPPLAPRDTRLSNGRSLVMVETVWKNGAQVVRAIDTQASGGVYTFKVRDWNRMPRK